jgi:hypothetical protein
MRAKHWIVVLVSIFALTGASQAGSLDSMLSKGLDSTLAKQLGVTSDQAKGGMGSILALGKEKLSSVDYGKLAGAIPGADKYIAKAKDMGVLKAPLGDTNGLNAALAKLGIPADKVAQFTPAVKQLVGQVGGPEIEGILSKFLP